ncbi:MAG: hypothetical protein WKG03_15565, partial [Telluria sp.]
MKKTVIVGTTLSLAAGAFLFVGCARAQQAATIAAGAATGCPPLTKIRYFPRKGFASRMERGRFTVSNAGPTTDFQTMAEIKGVP